MFEIEDEARRRAKGMAFCGYGHELARAEGIKTALAVLIDGAKCAEDEDLRADEPFQDALAYLDSRTGETAITGQIRRALELPFPEERRVKVERLAAELASRHADPAFFDLPGQR
jgi:hypothetical protein